MDIHIDPPMFSELKSLDGPVLDDLKAIITKIVTRNGQSLIPSIIEGINPALQEIDNKVTANRNLITGLQKKVDMLESVIAEIKASEIKNMTSVPNDSPEKVPASRLEQVQNILKKAKMDNEAREKCRILASKAAVVKDPINFTSHLCRVYTKPPWMRIGPFRKDVLQRFRIPTRFIRHMRWTQNCVLESIIDKEFFNDFAEYMAILDIPIVNHYNLHDNPLNDPLRKDANSNLLNGMTIAIQKIEENIRNKQKEGKDPHESDIQVKAYFERIINCFPPELIAHPDLDKRASKRGASSPETSRRLNSPIEGGLLQ
eukprot:Awhi_evm1s1072